MLGYPRLTPPPRLAHRRPLWVGTIVKAVSVSVSVSGGGIVASSGRKDARAAAVNVVAHLFASPSGSDSNPGTFHQPFLTPTKLFNELSPGQTGCLRGGLYRDPHLTPGAGYNLECTSAETGTAGNPKTLISFPDEVAIIEGHSIVRNGCDYVNFRRILFTGNNDETVMEHYGDHVEFDQCEITNSDQPAQGVLVGSNSSNWIVTAFKFTRCYFHDIGQAPSNLYHSIYFDRVEAVTLGDAAVQDCLFRNSQGGYITQFFREANKILFDHNTAYNHTRGITFSGTASTHSDDNVVSNNIVVLTTDVSDAWGATHFWSGAQIGTGNLIDGNIFFGMATGFTANGGIRMDGDGNDGYTVTNHTYIDPDFIDATNGDFTPQEAAALTKGVRVLDEIGPLGDNPLDAPVNSATAGGSVLALGAKNARSSITLGAGGTLDIEGALGQGSGVAVSAGGSIILSGHEGGLTAATVSTGGAITLSAGKNSSSAIAIGTGGAIQLAFTKETGQGPLMGEPSTSAPILVFGNLYPRLGPAPALIYPPPRWVSSAESTNRIGLLSISGGGAITVGGAKNANGSIALNGGGSTAAGGGVTFSATSISGAGNIVVSTRRGTNVSIALSSGGVTTVTGRKGVGSVSSELGGVPPLFLLISGIHIRSGGSITVFGTRIAGSATSTANGAVIGTGRKGGSTALALSTRGLVIVNGALASGQGSATISANGAQSATGRKQGLGIATTSAGSNLVIIGAKGTFASAISSANGTLVASGFKDGRIAALVTGQGALAVIGNKGARGLVGATGNGVLLVNGFGVRLISVSGNGSVQITSHRSARSGITLSGRGLVLPSGTKAANAGITISTEPRIVASGFGVLLGQGFALISENGLVVTLGNKQAFREESEGGNGFSSISWTKAISNNSVITGNGTIAVRLQRDRRSSIGRIVNRIGGSRVIVRRAPRTQIP